MSERDDERDNWAELWGEPAPAEPEFIPEFTRQFLGEWVPVPEPEPEPEPDHKQRHEDWLRNLGSPRAKAEPVSVISVDKGQEPSVTVASVVVGREVLATIQLPQGARGKVTEVRPGRWKWIPDGIVEPCQTDPTSLPPKT